MRDGSDEQKPYTRHKWTGKQPHHCNAQRVPKVHLFRYGSNGVKEDAITWRTERQKMIW